MVDAYAHARIENMLMRLSGSSAARTVTTRPRAPVAAGEGLEKVRETVHHVQLSRVAGDAR